MNAEAKQLFQELSEDGFIIEPGRKHWRLKNRAGVVIFTLSATPSCPRSVRNTRAQLKRTLGWERRPEHYRPSRESIRTAKRRDKQRTRRRTG